MRGARQDEDMLERAGGGNLQGEGLLTINSYLNRDGH
jgi:hypothetical protein